MKEAWLFVSLSEGGMASLSGTLSEGGVVSLSVNEGGVAFLVVLVKVWPVCLLVKEVWSFCLLVLRSKTRSSVVFLVMSIGTADRNVMVM